MKKNMINEGKRSCLEDPSFPTHYAPRGPGMKNYYCVTGRLVRAVPVLYKDFCSLVGINPHMLTTDDNEEGYLVETPGDEPNHKDFYGSIDFVTRESFKRNFRQCSPPEFFGSLEPLEGSVDDSPFKVLHRTATFTSGDTRGEQIVTVTAMEVPTGCLVRTHTQISRHVQGAPGVPEAPAVTETTTFVPGVSIATNLDGIHTLIKS